MRKKHYRAMRKYIVFLLFLFLYACNVYRELPAPALDTGWKSKVIPAYEQVGGGDPEQGFAYLKNGEYIGSGMPLELIRKMKRLSGNPDTVLNREGINADLAYLLTAFTAENGVEVVNGNCFTCHAGEFNGQIVIGLGNSFSDYRQNMSFMGKGLKMAMKLRYGKRSEEWAAYEDFGRYFEAMAPHIETNQPGVNPAAHLAEACVAFRDPQDLTYTEDPNFELPRYVIATDVPPLWNVRKKNALYYTAVGRGDFSKLLFQASVLGIPDSAAAREAVTNFVDVVAWLKSLEPPAYPGPIDQPLAQQGKLIFGEHCSGCHGAYGSDETYPNKVIALDVIKTDPYYATYAVQAPIVEWYNNSWFATSQPESFFLPEAGYIAPPLDGVWATAPYLHNGSVPTIEDLLNSKQRPAFWKRSGRSDDYDYQKIGWNYTVKNNGAGKWTYDTTIPGYSNAGHYFGDKLTSDQRTAVIEYLKTL